MNKSKFFLFFLFSIFTSELFYESKVESAKILTIYPSPSRSHYIPLEGLLINLAERGHEVTAVTFYPQKKPLKNFRDIALEIPTGFDYLIRDLVDHAGEAFYFLKQIFLINQNTFDALEAVFNNSEFIEITKKESFDLVIFEGLLGDVFMGYGSHFNCPIVCFSPIPPSPIVNQYIGNLQYYSFVGYTMFDHDYSPMNFVKRIAFVLFSIMVEILMYLMQGPNLQLYAKYFPQPQYPTFDEMGKNISLALVNYHFSQGLIRPNVPAYIEVGGLSVKEKPAPLPADLQKWMDDATEGVIYMSMGSMIKSTYFSHETVLMITQTFAKLKQRVVWKFENDTLPGLSDNVYISKWLPQDDLLAHPNLKLFITHGGLGGIFEAKVRGVPIIGIPMIFDHIASVAEVVHQGWGEQIGFLDLSNDKFYDTIQKVLSNSSYKENVRHLSKIFLDRPQSAMQTSVFWIEYVLRHQGAKHMQSNSVHLNFYQKHSLDVVGFLLAILLLILGFQYWILKRVWRWIFRKNVSQKNKSD